MVYESLQAIEAFSFVIALAGFSIIINFYGKKHPLILHFVLGFLSLVLGLLFTNLESIFFPNLFNLLEHVFRIFLPAVFFATAAYKISDIKKNGI